MKILYLSADNPSGLTGGSIGTQKFMKLFKLVEGKHNQKVWRIHISDKSVNEPELIEVRKNKFLSYFSRIINRGNQLSLYIGLIFKIIKKNEIKIVIIQSSRLGYITKRIKTKYPYIKIIQNFDNFEYGFSKMYFKNSNIIIKTLEKFNVKNSEYKALHYSDASMFLTVKDKEIIESFYSYKKDYSIVTPLLYEPQISISNKCFDELDKLRNEKRVGVFTGSLNMESNIEAVNFIFDNRISIFENTKLDRFVIAGRNPSEKMKKMLKNTEKIELIDSPSKEEMENVLKRASLYISPVFEGSGMKTKVFEALSYGIPIIASEHSLIGYDFLNVEEMSFVKKFVKGNNSFERSLKETNEKKFKVKEIISEYKNQFDTKDIIDKIYVFLLKVYHEK